MKANTFFTGLIYILPSKKYYKQKIIQFEKWSQTETKV